MSSIIFKVIVLVVIFMEAKCNQLKAIQKSHQPLITDHGTNHYLASLSNTQHINEVLDKILIPRVVGTPNHKHVFNYIKSQLESLNWRTDVDIFDASTPLGIKTFKNIIGTLNPKAERFLVLACHYDSKLFDHITFVGAIDSAVPCAMMLNLIKVMDKELKSFSSKNPISLKLIFFDGEEAFEKWGPTDSIYGAKHLAEVWNKNRQINKLTNEMVSDLERIDLFILLDLIGHKGSRFLSCFEDTQSWYLRLAKIEDELANLELLHNNHGRYFQKKRYLGYIEDDHIPFLKRNVPILHLISIPFNDAWHTDKDNRELIDMHTVEDINKILRIFVVQYLNVLVHK